MIGRVISTLKERRDRLLRGDINCIPFSLTRFSNDLPGIEKGKYYLVSGATKSSKTQITNYLFLYTPLLYAYNNPDKVRVKVFYFPLEETPENITLRFMSYLLYTMDGIRIAPIDLKSTSERKILPEQVLELLESDKYQDILKFYEENVIFLSDRNPTGAYKNLMRYANETGIVHKKKVNITNKETGLIEQKEVFDYYEPYDKNEYVIIITDHVSLLESERGFDLRQSIIKYSEYMMILRNLYNYIPVVIQQQSLETTNLEAFKNNKIRPTMAGLADAKNPGRDCSLMLGITSPYAHELPQYLGYDVSKLRGNIRFLEVVLNREGESNGIVALYFDGATNYFSELPLPNDKPGLTKVYQYIDSLRNMSKPLFMLFSKTKCVNHLHGQSLKDIFALNFNFKFNFRNGKRSNCIR